MKLILCIPVSSPGLPPPINHAKYSIICLPYLHPSIMQSIALHVYLTSYQSCKVQHYISTLPTINPAKYSIVCLPYLHPSIMQSIALHVYLTSSYQSCKVQHYISTLPPPINHAKYSTTCLPYLRPQRTLWKPLMLSVFHFVSGQKTF